MSHDTISVVVMSAILILAIGSIFFERWEKRRQANVRVLHDPSLRRGPKRPKWVRNRL